MRAIDPNEYLRQIRPILGALKAPVMETVPGRSQPTRVIHPFITISREAGTGARSLAQRLVERLNQEQPVEPAWSCWDGELVDKVAAEHNIAAELVEMLEEADRNWLTDFLGGLSVSEERPTEESVYRYTATTIRALAKAGHVVLVGRGSVMLTRNMPGGIHVRLVAPLAYRIEHLAQVQQLDQQEAEAEIKRLDRARAAFFRRYWPGHPVNAELFHLTLNAARVDEARMVESILALVPKAKPRARSTTGEQAMQAV